MDGGVDQTLDADDSVSKAQSITRPSYQEGSQTASSKLPATSSDDITEEARIDLPEIETAPPPQTKGNNGNKPQVPASIDLRRSAISTSLNALLSLRISGLNITKGETSSTRPDGLSSGSSTRSHAYYHQQESEPQQQQRLSPFSGSLPLFMRPRRWIERTCLNPEYTLRTQLLWSFGTLNFLTLGFLVVICIAVTLFVGNDFQELNAETFSNALGQGLQGRTARYLAESLERQIYPKDTVNLIYEMTHDRFAGYPHDIETDQHVPYPTMDPPHGSGRNEYPIIGPDLPLDWQLDRDQYDLSDAGRRHWYLQNRPLSTSVPAFLMQGACDPEQSDPDHYSFWEGCTDEHNDIALGGALQPSNLTQHIYRKARDLAPVLKALYEYNANFRNLGIYFANQGAGAGITFPHFPLEGGHNFVSIGCDWMSTTTNPVDPSKGPILDATFTQSCPPEGTAVPTRAYNPMLRGWCQRQAVEANTGNVLVEGPYLDAFIPGNWLLSFGRAVYDRVTSEFVACTFIGLQLDFMQGILRDARLTDQSEISLVRFNAQGSLVASSDFDFTNYTGDLPLFPKLKLGLNDDMYNQLYNLVDFEKPWDPQEVKEAYLGFSGLMDHGFFISAYPIPTIPEDYDASYKPEFLVIVSISESDVLEVVDVVNGSVEDNMFQSILFAALVGFAGFGFSMLLLLVMARELTRPLQIMNSAAEEICDSFGKTDVDGTKSIHSLQIDACRCMPRTEVTELVSRFNEMVSSFSGSLLTQSEQTKQVEATNIFLTGVETGVRKELADSLYMAGTHDKFPFVQGDDDSFSSGFGPPAAKHKESSSDEHMEENDFVESTDEVEESTIVFNKESDEDILQESSTMDQPFQPQSREYEKSFRSDMQLQPVAEDDEVIEDFRSNSFDTPTLFSNIIHCGRNIHYEGIHQVDLDGNISMLEARGKVPMTDSPRWTFAKGLKSPLFIWIVILIVAPLVVTEVAISTVVLITVADSFDDSIDDSEAHYYNVEVSAMNVTAQLRASFVASNTGRSIRDLYLLTRYGGWLLFGGLDRSSSFPKAMSSVSECKDKGSFDQCPWAIDNRVCDCTWDWEPKENQCQELPDDGRADQVPFFFLSLDQADEDGSRFGTDFPLVHDSPETTLWRDTLDSIPGSEARENSTGYATSYDRVRSILASPLFAPLFNYYEGTDARPGSYYGFEDDGLFVGYDGCMTSEHGWAAYWQSSEEGNGGPNFNESLCPEGRYGYDPRCRGWYSVGKEEMLDKGHSIYITPPFIFSSGTNLIGQTACSALTDPNTKEFVGQALVDMFSGDVLSILNENNTFVRPGGFSLMITTVSERGADTVVGPGLEDSLASAVPVNRVVLPYDQADTCAASSPVACEERSKSFDKIVRDMKDGLIGTGAFMRTTESGGVEEIVISYAPALTRFLEANDASNFTRGATARERAIYSIALVQPRTSILQPFDATEDSMNRKMVVAICVVSIFLFFAIVSAISVSYGMASSIAQPMLYLVEMVKLINQADSGERLPAIKKTAGPKEITYVSNTIHSLFQAVSLANSFYKAGELEAAYHLLMDALKLFKRMDNKKASKL